MLNQITPNTPRKLAIVLAWLIIASALGAILPPPEPEVEALRKSVAAIRSPTEACELLLQVIKDDKKSEALRLAALRLLTTLADQSHAERLIPIGARKGNSPRVASAARVGIWRIFLRDADVNSKKARLLELLRGTYTGHLPATGDIQSWAAERLCDMGATEAFKEIRDVMIADSDFPRAIHDVRFCKERMDMVSSTSTLEAAYIKAMLEPSSDSDRRLGRWGFSRLKDVESEVVDEAFIKAALLEIERKQRHLYDPIYYELERRGWKREQLRERGLTWPPAIY